MPDGKVTSTKNSPCDIGGISSIPSLGINNLSEQKSGSFNLDGTDIIYSAGLSYGFKAFTLYAEYEVIDLTIKASEFYDLSDEEYFESGDVEDGSLDATSLHLGIVYNF